MFGLILALLWSGWQLMHGAALMALFPGAVNFLYWWYLVWAIITGLIYLVALVFLVLGVGIVGFDKLGIFGGAVGLLGSGIIGIILLGLSWLAGSVLPIIGALLLKDAIVNGEWDYTRLIFGFVLIIVGIIASRSGSSHSSSSSKS